MYDEIYPKKTLTPKEIEFDDSEGFNDSAVYGFYEINSEDYYLDEIYGSQEDPNEHLGMSQYPKNHK